MKSVGVRSAVHHVLNRRGHDSKALDPWYFPSITEYTNLLRASSFRPVHVSLNPRMTELSEDGVRGWLQVFVRHSFLKDFSHEEADAIIQEVVDICEVDCKDNSGDKDGEGIWSMMYMRLRVHAILDEVDA